MKAFTILLKLLIISLLVLFGSCKKEAGPGGKNSISGKVSYKNGVTGGNSTAANATIYIYYGTKTAGTEFNQAIVTDGNGNYKFNSLQKGEYFIKADYRDANGFYYSTTGYAIELNNKKSNLEIDITLE
ncbi:MAG: carboxypeptidase-like regulatory domain-containing protein [Sphingobacteriaceae bacterium]|jgi:hypothetical protein